MHLDFIAWLALVRNLHGWDQRTTLEWLGAGKTKERSGGSLKRLSTLVRGRLHGPLLDPSSGSLDGI